MGAWHLVRKYVAEHGRLPPLGVVYCDFPLGDWCFEVRQKYNRGDEMSQRCIDGLNSIPEWTWDPWLDYLSALREYVAEFGGQPPRGKWYCGLALGKWCLFRRWEYEEEMLSRKWITDLETVPGWSWDIFS